MFGTDASTAASTPLPPGPRHHLVLHAFVKSEDCAALGSNSSPRLGHCAQGREVGRLCGHDSQTATGTTAGATLQDWAGDRNTWLSHSVTIATNTPGGLYVDLRPLGTVGSPMKLSGSTTLVP